MEILDHVRLLFRVCRRLQRLWIQHAEGDAAPTQAILSIRARGGIAVMIAHRPSATAGVDLVLAMKQGRAMAFGPKDEVLARVLHREPPPPCPLKVVPEFGSA